MLLTISPALTAYQPKQRNSQEHMRLVYNKMLCSGRSRCAFSGSCSPKSKLGINLDCGIGAVVHPTKTECKPLYEYVSASCVNSTISADIDICCLYDKSLNDIRTSTKNGIASPNLPCNAITMYLHVLLACDCIVPSNNWHGTIKVYTNFANFSID